jgi:hypothetical protein
MTHGPWSQKSMPAGGRPGQNKERPAGDQVSARTGSKQKHWDSYPRGGGDSKGTQRKPSVPALTSLRRDNRTNE